MSAAHRSNDLGLCLFFMESGTAKRFIEIMAPYADAEKAVRVDVSINLGLPLGFEVEHQLGHGTSGCLIVTHVTEGGQAAAAGVAIGQWLVAINGEEVSAMDELVKTMKDLQNMRSTDCKLVFQVRCSKPGHGAALTQTYNDLTCQVICYLHHHQAGIEFQVACF